MLGDERPELVASQVRTFALVHDVLALARTAADLMAELLTPAHACEVPVREASFSELRGHRKAC